MRIALLHNHKAGRHQPIDEVGELIRQNGHVVTQLLDRHNTDTLRVDSAVEVLVAAGGDGTVARAARLAISADIPMTILPLGTANNVATSMGVTGATPDLIAGWRSAAYRAVDVGMAETADGEQLFLESVGAGLVPAVIDSMRAQPRSERQSAERQVVTAMERYRELLPLVTPTRWDITADGVRAEHHLIMFEALNMPAVGPNLRLSPEANATDGLLSLVLVDETNRQNLMRVLEAQQSQQPTAAALPVVHVKRVEIRGGDVMHFDDRVYWPETANPIVLTVKSGALTLLA